MTQLRAINYTAGRALFEGPDSYVVIDTNKRDVLEQLPKETPLTAAAWLRVAPDLEYPKVWKELADAATTTLDVKETRTQAHERSFRIPDAVRVEAQQALDWVKGFERGYSNLGNKFAEKIVSSKTLSATDIARAHKYFNYVGKRSELAGWSAGEQGYPTNERIRFSMRGGNAGREWVEKIAAKHSLTVENTKQIVDGNDPHGYQDDPELPGSCVSCGRENSHPIHMPVTASAFQIDPTCDYFGHGLDPDTTIVDALYMLRPDGTWAERENDQWIEMDEPDATDLLIMLDPESAQTLATIIDDEIPENPRALPFELSMLNSHEAALFALAEPEIDWEMVQRVFDIYDSTERSANAGKQVRDTGGRFGDQPGGGGDGTSDQAPAVTKARLAAPLPLVPDVATLIQQYLASVGQEEPAPETPAPAPTAQANTTAAEYLNLLLEKYSGTRIDASVFAGVPQPAPQAAEAEAAPAGPRPLYLALVDKVDTEAVLDVVSLMPGPPPVMWKRDKGAWIQAPEILAALQGASPPPVVELQDDALVANVLKQVDASTSQDEGDEEETTPGAGASPQNPNGSPNAPKPDANPDQHPVAASGETCTTHPCECKGCDEFDCGLDGCACCWVFDENDVLVRDFADVSAKRREKLAKKGYALPDGSYPIPDVEHLKKAIQAFGRAKNKEAAKNHIIKRARALNRADLIPDDWKKSSNSTVEFALYGPHGQLMNLALVAEGGADRNRGNAEKLRHYWTRGEGGLKVGWNTPGDMTRCMKFLAKYLRGREAGYCALRHKEMTGMWPGDRRNLDDK